MKGSVEKCRLDAVPKKEAGGGCAQRWRGAVIGVIAALGLGVYAGSAQAIPAFARQTGMQCNACHEPYPQLNAYGREFKMLGYTQEFQKVPFYYRFAGMLQPTFTHNEHSLAPDTPPEDFSRNDNFALSQASIFYGGRVIPSWDTLGAFVQVTYDGVGKAFAWDNADIRYAKSGLLFGKPTIFGIDVNNNPTVQDPWNTTPAWGFPFSSAPDGLANTPAAATLINGGLETAVVGAGGYTLWDKTLYGEVNVYQTPGSGFLKAMGLQPGSYDSIQNAAPYWRFALQHKWGLHYLEVGTFGLYANTYPGGDTSAGTNEFVDTGLDAQYQYTNKMHYFTGRLRWIHEDQTLDASYMTGDASHRSNHLDSIALSGTYLYDQSYGLDFGFNHITGSSDMALYGGSPDSTYETVQLDWLPFNKNGGPSFYPWFNPKISLQYVIYNKFDGTTTNASDNNTLFLQAWLMF